MGVAHEGEQAVQRLAGEGAPGWGSPMFDGSIGGFAAFIRQQRLVALSGRDAEGAVWCTVLTGDEGFVEPVDDRTIVVHALPPPGDPLRDAFVQPGSFGMVVLSPPTLRRVKVAGTARREGDGLVLRTEQVLGNCPKYLQMRTVIDDSAARAAPLATVARELSADQQAMVRSADTFFIGSHAAGHGADANHRGGLPGFVAVTGPRSLSWPDYLGNSFFMTLGNIQLDPRCGLAFLDWETGRTLQLSGTASINWDQPRAREFPGARRLIEFETSHVVDIERASRLRWQLLGRSRFNPPVSGPAASHTSRPVDAP
ncbi:pyridoxamine 5'-phosphate oxidase family protein [Micromonospora mirobrigensis]|uniref:Uncharacterized protein n=1 Tax=Micromonospora mirobrigensis TaxID=262898 RepID=A0A1C4WYX9_9ACTN|nr:pyridoxamine 5'-phosphate oxidase family protein [Micromonospora mirobrigensis]SCF01432.1 hypothetical protein GA0070564_102602 [Micromonospora mirobrigensis]